MKGSLRDTPANCRQWACQKCLKTFTRYAWEGAVNPHAHYGRHGVLCHGATYQASNLLMVRTAKRCGWRFEA